MTEPKLAFTHRLDIRRISEVYAAAGRVHIAPILSQECAVRVWRCLVEETPWQLHFNEGDMARDMPLGVLSEEQKRALSDSLHERASRGFQYLFDNFPISDAYALGRHRKLYLMRVLEFLNSNDFLMLVRQVTGVGAIAEIDAQATCYEPGHFLTRHDDFASGVNRVAAYVLNFTPRWSASWGGVLNFIDSDGHVSEGYVPAFNALNLFKVPQPHAVSYVAPYAQAGRYSITGWLKTS